MKRIITYRKSSLHATFNTISLKTSFLALLIPLLGYSQSTRASLQATPEKGDTDTIKKVEVLKLEDISLSDDPFVARLDSMLNLTFFISDSSVASTEEFTNTDDTAFVAPSFSDSIYAYRLSVLDAGTPFKLDYNDYVKRYIDVYAQRRREQVSRMLGLSAYYFPMFEEALDRYNMPLELKYLAIVESALNPAARSRVGAAGLWQFMYATGRMNGLKVTSYVDERNDPLKSTEAACKYLQTLYGIFGDWNLALAAYNSGPGNVNKAIRRSGGKRDYWEIRPFLPRETAGYVPAFIAVNYIMNYSSEHFIFPTDVKPSYFSTDTIKVKEQLSFEQISELIDIEEEELAFLNPAYRYKVIPKNEKDPYTLILPSQKMGLFIANEDSIYSIAQKHFEQEEEKKPEEIEMGDRIRHTVRRGEVLGTIAEKYGVSVRSIRGWNGLRGNTIRVGQRLTIYPRKVPSSTTYTASSTAKPTAKDAKGDYVLHSVRSGETFYSIAKRYPGISAQNIMSWNGFTNARHLKPGMRIKIYPNS